MPENRDDNSLINDALDVTNEIQNLAYRKCKLMLDRNASDDEDQKRQDQAINAALMAAWGRLQSILKAA